MRLVPGFAVYFSGLSYPVFFTDRGRAGQYIQDVLSEHGYQLNKQGKQAIRNFVESVTDAATARTCPNNGSAPARFLGDIQVYAARSDNEANCKVSD